VRFGYRPVIGGEFAQSCSQPFLLIAMALVTQRETLN
jgi:hypothetical protein